MSSVFLFCPPFLFFPFYLSTSSFLVSLLLILSQRFHTISSTYLKKKYGMLRRKFNEWKEEGMQILDLASFILKR